MLKDKSNITIVELGEVNTEKIKLSVYSMSSKVKLSLYSYTEKPPIPSVLFCKNDLTKGEVRWLNLSNESAEVVFNIYKDIAFGLKKLGTECNHKDMESALFFWDALEAAIGAEEVMDQIEGLEDVDLNGLSDEDLDKILDQLEEGEEFEMSSFEKEDPPSDWDLFHMHFIDLISERKPNLYKITRVAPYLNLLSNDRVEDLAKLNVWAMLDFFGSFDRWAGTPSDPYPSIAIIEEYMEVSKDLLGSLILDTSVSNFMQSILIGLDGYKRRTYGVQDFLDFSGLLRDLRDRAELGGLDIREDGGMSMKELTTMYAGFLATLSARCAGYVSTRDITEYLSEYASGEEEDTDDDMLDEFLDHIELSELSDLTIVA
jgi:translation elongation factor EF-1beta